MHAGVTLADRVEDVIPFAFDIRAVGVHPVLEPALGEDALALGHFLADGGPDADGHQAEIDDHMHDQLFRVDKYQPDDSTYNPSDFYAD